MPSKNLDSIIKQLKETFKFRYVIYNYVYSSLKQKYRRSVLGFLWSVVAPLLNNLIIGVVFYYLMRFDMPNYIVYLFSGILIYNLLSTIIMQSPYIMINNEGFIKKIYVPKLVFVMEVIFLEVINFFLIMLSLIILGIIFNKLSFSVHYIYIPISIILSVLFVSGIAIIISIMAVYFRDMIHIVPVVMQAVFFLTPILYPLSVVPPRMQKIIKLNPLYYYVEIFRMPIFSNQFPSYKYLIFCVIMSLLMFFSGLFILNKYNNRIIFKL